MPNTFEGVSEVRLTVYRDRLEAAGVQDVRSKINETLKGVNVQINGDEITVRGKNLTVATATGGQIMITTHRGKVVVGSGYSFTKKVIVDGKEIWKNKDEGKK